MALIILNTHLKKKFSSDLEDSIIHFQTRINNFKNFKNVPFNVRTYLVSW